MPLFEGEEVFEWVHKAERFFRMQGLMNSSEQLRVLVLCLEGPELSWFLWSYQRTPFQSWEELKAGLLDRFQSSRDGNLHQ